MNLVRQINKIKACNGNRTYDTRCKQDLLYTHVEISIKNRLIDFNGMSSRLRIFYA